MSDNGGLSSSSINDGQQRRVSQPEDALAKIVEETESGRQAWTKNVLSVIAICGIGAAGWVIAWQTGAWTPAPQEHDGEKDMVAGAQVLGYASALCYLRWVDLSVHIPSSSGGFMLTKTTVRACLRSIKTIARSPAKVFIHDSDVTRTSDANPRTII